MLSVRKMLLIPQWSLMMERRHNLCSILHMRFSRSFFLRAEMRAAAEKEMTTGNARVVRRLLGAVQSSPVVWFLPCHPRLPT
jgi:hypothetical protein